MYCRPEPQGDVSSCYRVPIFLGLPLLIAVGGFAIGAVQEMKIRRKKTFFSIATAIKCMGGEDWVRLVLFVLTGVSPLVAYFVEVKQEWDVDAVPSHRIIDALIFSVLPWCFLCCYWLVHEVRRGSEEWLWIRLFSFVQVVGESLKLWSEVINLENDYSSQSHRHFVVVTGIVILTIKCVTSFSMICFNRDWRRLRNALRENSPSNELEDALILNSQESFNNQEEEVELAIEQVGDENKMTRTPEQYAGLLSRLTFFWLETIMAKGANTELEQSDFYKLLKEDDVYSLSRRFLDTFRVVKIEEDELCEASKASTAQVVPTQTDEYQALADENNEEIGEEGEEEKTGSSPKEEPAPGNLRLMLKSLHRAGVLMPFYQAAVFKFIYDTLLFVSPQILRHLIVYLTHQDERPVTDGYFYVGLMFGVAVFQTFVLQAYFHKVFRTAMRVRSALLTNVYRKSLRLTPSARVQRTTGEIVNLMSTDCERLSNLFPYLHVTWSSPYQVLLALFFLWREVKYAVIVAVFVILCLMTPLTIKVTKKIKSIQQDLMKVKDKRIRVTGEAITSVKVIKLSGWEQTFREKVNEARKEELVLLRKYLIWRAGARTMWTATPVLVSLATFATFVLMGGTLDAATAFTSLSLLNLLRFPLNVLPNIMNGAIEASVSLRRIANFLESPELDSSAIQHARAQAERPTGVAVIVKNGNFYWDDQLQKQALRDLDVELKEGSINVVTGQVGSGKSAFLSMLVGELQPDPKSIVAQSGTVSLASQVPWIQNATLRDNILFGCPYDREWYNHVVYSCALVADFKQLEDGDETEIGERGINLSGGQKARVALARAVYSRADLVLLETVFEAVDEHVGAFLWKNCIQGILKEPLPHSGRKRTVIIVTHALKYVHEADLVLVMKAGAIVEQGRYDDIVEDKNSELARLSVRVMEMEREEKSRKDSEGEAEDASNGPPELQRKASSFRKSKGTGGLTGKEERAVGQVSWGVYSQYMQAVGGWCTVVLVLIGLSIRTLFDTGNSAWLAYWSSKTKPDHKHENYTTIQESLPSAHRLLAQISQVASSFPQYQPDMVSTQHDGYGSASMFSTENEYETYVVSEEERGTAFYLGVYAGISFSGLLFIGVITAFIALTALNASRVMHERMLTSVLRSPMSFFDTTPIGRILNRFSKDIYCIDETLPDSLYSFLSTIFGVLGTLGTIAAVQPLFLTVVPFMFVAYLRIQRFYISTSRQVKRWDSVLRSPIYSHFSESLDGVSTIRAYSASSRFVQINLKQLDTHQSAYYISVSSNRWLAVRLETCASILVLVTSGFVVMFRSNSVAAFGALAISYAISITQTLNWTVRMSSDVETNVVSVERIEEYTRLAPEAPEDAKDSNKIPSKESNWPSNGEIVFENVHARYRPGLEEVLKGVSFTIPGGHKVGIVGRTGSGKSTTLLLLLRIIEASEGKIMIDGYNTVDFGLQRLRESMSIIPQDPVMFSASLRYNLDPKNAFSDEDIWRSLEITQLKDHVEALAKEMPRGSNLLDMEITEGGGNFSFGQRQLICIARAILRRSKIILLDEATSGIDSATDDLIQETIRTEFKDSTVLTIAHRLTTIQDGDGIIVMDDGRLAEYDTPQNLLENKDSLFSKLVQQMKKNK